jgi:hypothetical protein
MASKGTTRIERGQAITFRIPSDTQDHIMKQLQKLKETERRNFSSTIADFALAGVSQSLSKDREKITIPLPKPLSKEQRNWLKHSHSEAMLGSIVYQLLADPIRATSILASLNSNALDINEALYLQDDDFEKVEFEAEIDTVIEVEQDHDDNTFDDDLMNFDWGQASQEHAVSKEESSEAEEEEDIEDLLGGFLSNMNK